MEIRELRIPVSWGHIAVKAWGNEQDPIVLVIHGWVDNAGSFDKLIPLLPATHYYYCIDLPSHGKSSHLESTLFVHTFDYLIVLKLVYEYLNRGKLILMGHSMGGSLVTNFAQFYPECVSKIIVIDVLHSYPKSVKNFYSSQRLLVNERTKMLKRERNDVPVYSKEEALRRMERSRMTPVSREAIEILAERNLEKVGDGKYRFTLPQHTKLIVFGYYTLQGIVEISKWYPIKCPHLVIMSKNSSMTRLALREVEEEFRKNKDYEFHIVNGNHECHLDYAEDVEPVITNFLNKYQSKL